VSLRITDTLSSRVSCSTAAVLSLAGRQRPLRLTGRAAMSYVYRDLYVQGFEDAQNILTYRLRRPAPTSQCTRLSLELSGGAVSSMERTGRLIIREDVCFSGPPESQSCLSAHMIMVIRWYRSILKYRYALRKKKKIHMRCMVYVCLPRSDHIICPRSQSVLHFFPPFFFPLGTRAGSGTGGARRWSSSRSPTTKSSKPSASSIACRSSASQPPSASAISSR
jgi:hypothetical protein